MRETVDNELRLYPVLAKLSREQLLALREVGEDLEIAQGEVFIREGDASEELFLIRSGTVEIVTSARDEDYLLRTLGPGDPVGEMAFVDGAVRSASARAGSDVVLFKLTRAALAAADTDGTLTHGLVLGITRDTMHRLRTSTRSRVAAVEERLELVENQNQAGRFVTYILIAHAIGTLINYAMATEFAWVNPYNPWFAWLYLVVVGVPAGITVWVMEIPLADLGMTTARWKQSVVEAIAVIIGLSIPFYGVLWTLQAWGVAPTPAEAMDVPLSMVLLGLPPYLVHSFFQEFLARGMLQTFMQRFFDDQRGWWSIGLTSLTFGLLHINFGLHAVVGVGLSSVLFGLFYVRTHNLIGVTLFHAATGVVALSTGFL